MPVPTVRFELEDLGSPAMRHPYLPERPGETVLVGAYPPGRVESHDGAVLKVDLGRQNWPHGP
jgi:hypothetical protein